MKLFVLAFACVFALSPNASQAFSFTCPAPESIARNFDENFYYLEKKTPGSLEPGVWSFNNPFFTDVPDLVFTFNHVRAIDERNLTCFYSMNSNTDSTIATKGSLKLQFKADDHFSPILSIPGSDRLGQCHKSWRKCYIEFSTDLLIAVINDIDFYRSINAGHIPFPNVISILSPYRHLYLGTPSLATSLELTSHRFYVGNAIEIRNPEEFSFESRLSIYDGISYLPIYSALSATSPSQLCGKPLREIVETIETENVALTLILKPLYANGFLTSLTCEEYKTSLVQPWIY